MTEDRLKSTIPIPFFFRKFLNDRAEASQRGMEITGFTPGDRPFSIQSGRFPDSRCRNIRFMTCVFYLISID